MNDVYRDDKQVKQNRMNGQQMNNEERGARRVSSVIGEFLSSGSVATNDFERLNFLLSFEITDCLSPRDRLLASAL